jgi:hypothetical protein
MMETRRERIYDLDDKHGETGNTGLVGALLLFVSSLPEFAWRGVR